MTKKDVNRDITRNRTRPALILPPMMMMIILWGIGLTHWFVYQQVMYLIFFGYIGLIVGAGIGGYIAAADRYRPYARRLVILLVGSLLLAVAFVTNHGNMQIEGFFWALLAGGGSYILLHFGLGKIFGPLVFGRVWCGWACWYAMIFDLLPYPFSHYRRHPHWGRGRYIHFGVSLAIVLVLWFGLGFALVEGRTAMLFFASGVMLYFIVGIIMAFVLKDNRAFCKYLCPLSVPMKFSAQFSLLKISGIPDKCDDCEACVEMCPMDIRVRDYIVNNERVLSTECTQCLTCVSVCPHDSLTLSLGFEKGGKDYTDYDPTKGNRNTIPIEDIRVTDP